jgi:hypothetical protein
MYYLNICLGNVQNIISTNHYPTVTDTKESLLGESINILQDDLVLEGKSKQIRDLIFIGHGFGFKFKVLENLGLYLNSVYSVIEIFDAQFLGY